MQRQVVESYEWRTGNYVTGSGEGQDIRSLGSNPEPSEYE